MENPWEHVRIPQEVLPASLPKFSYDSINKAGRIGAGGDADVYKATVEYDGSTYPIAVKEPRFEGTISTNVIEQFQQEAETWTTLDEHANIVTVYSYDNNPLPWIALEYMDGGTIEARIGKCTVSEALWLGGRISEAVRHGHRHGIAHLDLKPTNILLRETPEDTWPFPKVSDWGLAKLLLEHSGSINGISPTYAAPEQFDPEEFGKPNDMTDIYQLGAVVYALLAGRPPFTGPPTAIMQSVLTDSPEPPSAYNSSVPEWVDDAVLKALSKEKQDRYEAVVLFRQTLDELFGQYIKTTSSRANSAASSASAGVNEEDSEVVETATNQASETNSVKQQSNSEASSEPGSLTGDTTSGSDSMSAEQVSQAESSSSPTQEQAVKSSEKSGRQANRSAEQNDSSRISRRLLLSVLGVVTVGVGGFALDDIGTENNAESTASNDGAGNGNSGGSGGGGSGNLGERVPDPIILEYWSNMGAETTQHEQILPDMQANIEDALDVNVEVRPTEFATQVSNITNDQRTHHLSLWYHTNTLDRLDPQEMTRRFAIDWAGGNGNANPNNWANCEFSDPAINQAFASDEESRQELVTEAHRIMAENMATLPFLQTMLLGAIDNTKVNLAGADNAGISNINPNAFILSTPVDGDRILVNGNPTEWETTNFPTNPSSSAIQLWSQLICSPLAEYDENIEITGVLASDWETEENGSLIRVFLEEDMQFHDGMEITATDVQFTFQHIWENSGLFPQSASPPYDSVDIVDEKTVEFVFDRPYLPLISREWPRWGIFNRKVWEESGMAENPSAGSAPIQGTASGPFMLTDFTRGEFAALDPHPHNHPKYNVAHGIDFQVYSDMTAATEGFLSRELEMFQKASPGAISRIKEDGGDWVTTVEIPGFMGHQIYPQMNIAPGKFRAFRKAIGQTYDIDLFNEIGWRNQGNPDTLPVSIRQAHPFRLDSWDEDFPHYTEGTGPNFEAARQTLMDAGWGWDDNGNLRYPADADTSELWPAESTPMENPDDWKCINSDGELEL